LSDPRVTSYLRITWRSVWLSTLATQTLNRSSSQSSSPLLPAFAVRELAGWNGSFSGKKLSPNHANPRSGNEANSAVGGSGHQPLFTRNRKDAVCCICTSLHLHLLLVAFCTTCSPLGPKTLLTTFSLLNTCCMSPQPVASPSYSKLRFPFLFVIAKISLLMRMLVIGLKYAPTS
jgi:hypothetical protein